MSLRKRRVKSYLQCAVKRILRDSLVAYVEKVLVLPDCWIDTWSVTAILNATCALSVAKVLMIHSIWRGTLGHIQVFGRTNVISARNHSPSGVLWKVTVLKYMALLIVTSTNNADQRCMYVRIVAIPPRSLRCTIYIWRSSIHTPLPSSNSTTRGISNSTAPTLRRICCRGETDRLYMRVLIGVFLSSVIFPDCRDMSAVFPLLILIYSTLCIITIISIDDLNSFHNLYKYLSLQPACNRNYSSPDNQWCEVAMQVSLFPHLIPDITMIPTYGIGLVSWSWYPHPHYSVLIHWHLVIVIQWCVIPE